MKTRFLILATITMALSGLLQGCGVGEANVVSEQAVSDSTPIPVNVAQPVRADIDATYRATATVYSDSDAPAIARVGGQVVEILVEEGSRVTRGQLLAQLDGERLRLAMLSARANLDKASKEYQRNIDLHKRGLISAAMFDGLKFELDALRATYELRKLDYEYSGIRAPIAGVVSARNIKPGQNLQANDVAFQITNTTELRAELRIPQSELSKFAPGHVATLTIDAMPETNFEATIARISPTIDTRDGTFRATAFIDNGDGWLAPGMFARFTIAYEKHENALVIPLDAVIEEDSNYSVFVVNDGEVTQRAITTGIRSAGRVEVLSGLEDNEYIVTQGQASLRSGSKVLASNRQSNRLTG